MFLRNQGQVGSSLWQIPVLPLWVSRVAAATPALSLLPLRAQFILSSDICFAPTMHALPTGIQTGTMNTTEDGEDKDVQLRLAVSVMRGGLTEGEVCRENVTVARQLKSRRPRCKYVASYQLKSKCRVEKCRITGLFGCLNSLPLYLLCRKVFLHGWGREVKNKEMIWSSNILMPFLWAEIAPLITQPLYLPLMSFFPQILPMSWLHPRPVDTLSTTSPSVYLYPSFSNLSLSPVSSHPHSHTTGIHSRGRHQALLG